MPDLILGVDGGASKTHLALADRAGRLRAFVAGPGTNHEWRGMVPIRKIFAEMVSRACRAARARPRDIKAGCWGLCGGDLPEDFTHIHRDAIRPLGLGGPSRVTNDAFIALFNDRWRDRGVAVTSGSWTKWLGLNGSATFMHDYAGHAGIRFIATRELTRVHEGLRSPDRFTAALLRFTGFPSYEEFFNRTIYGDDKRSYIRHTTPAQAARITRIPEFLAAAARRGDRGARRVLAAYATELVEGTVAVIRRLGLRGAPYDVVLSGAVLAHNPVLRGMFRRSLRPLAPAARVVSAVARPIRGALNHAAHRAGWTWPAGALREPVLWYAAAR